MGWLFQSRLRAARRKRRQRGNAAIEIALLSPWIFFLFIGVCDVGFYTTEMIGVENAARVAAEYTSQNATVAADSAGACARALNELGALPNVGSQTDCSSSVSSNAVVVTTATVTGPDSEPATSVTVSYRGAQLIPIPGTLTGALTITRSVKMRIKP